jgi:excisionase family DNA binding protein
MNPNENCPQNPPPVSYRLSYTPGALCSWRDEQGPQGFVAQLSLTVPFGVARLLVIAQEAAVWTRVPQRRRTSSRVAASRAARFVALSGGRRAWVALSGLRVACVKCRRGVSRRATVSGMCELPSPDPSLVDEVVRLGAWSQNDVDAVHAATQDPLIPRFTHVLEKRTRDEVRQFIEGREPARHSGGVLPLVITDAQTDVLLGAISLMGVEWEHRRGAIGLWLARWARGRGVATRAVALPSRWALTELALARVELGTYIDSYASQRVAERCGFVREGVLRSRLQVKGSPPGPRDRDPEMRPGAGGGRGFTIRVGIGVACWCVDGFMTVAAVASRLRLNQQTVRNWIGHGSLSAVRVGRRVRILRRGLDALVEAGATSRADRNAARWLSGAAARSPRRKCRKRSGDDVSTFWCPVEMRGGPIGSV